MLILTRKAEQGIVIDGKVVIRLLSIDGERVKIGIEAPRSVSVLREELLVEVADQNQAAARAPRLHGVPGVHGAGGTQGQTSLTQVLQGLQDRGRPPAGVSPIDDIEERTTA
ncbi:MAG: carbon storage regulator [Dehalococcoidia bacterium]